MIERKIVMEEFIPRMPRSKGIILNAIISSIEDVMEAGTLAGLGDKVIYFNIFEGSEMDDVEACKKIHLVFKEEFGFKLGIKIIKKD